MLGYKLYDAMNVFFTNTFTIPVIIMNIGVKFEFPSKFGDNLMDTKNIRFTFLYFSFGFDVSNNDLNVFVVNVICLIIKLDYILECFELPT